MFEAFDPTEVACKPSKQQQIDRERAIEIIRQQPGISIGEICRQYYGKSGVAQKNMAGMLTQLCLDNKIEYQPINCYRVSKSNE